MLPTIAQVVTDMLDGAAEQRGLLAGARPYSLDNATLDPVRRPAGRRLPGRTGLGQRHGPLMHPRG